MLNNTDVLQVCADMLQRCGMTAEHLLAHMGEAPVKQARPARPTRADDALAMASHAGGCSSCEVRQALGLAETTVSALLVWLRRAGELHRVQIPGKRGARWFKHQVDADAYRDHVAVQQAPATINCDPVAKAAVAKAATRPVTDAPVRVTAGPAKMAPKLVGEVITPEGVKRTVAPTPRGRYEVMPSEVMSGGFMADWQTRRGGC